MASSPSSRFLPGPRSYLPNDFVHRAAGPDTFLSDQTEKQRLNLFAFIGLGLLIIVDPGFGFSCIDEMVATTMLWNKVSKLVRSGVSKGLLKFVMSDLTIWCAD